MNQSRRAMTGIFLDVSGSALLLVCNILAVPIYLKLFGVEGYGYWATLLSQINLAFLIDSGTTLYLVKEFCQAETPEEGRANSFAFSNAMVAQFTATILALALFTLSVYLSFDNESNSLLSFFSLAVYTLTFLLTPYRLMLYASHHLAAYNLLGVANNLISIIAPILLFKIVPSLAAFPLGLLIANITTDLISVFLSKSRLSNARFKWQDISIGEVRRILTTGGLFTALKASDILKANLPRVLIAHLVGPAAVATFSIISKAPDLIVSYAAKISGSTLPLISSKMSSGVPVEIQKSARFMFQISMRLAGIALIGCFSLNGTFVRIWVPGIQFDAVVSAIIVVLMALKVFQSGTGSVLISTGGYRLLPVISVVEVTLGSIFSLTFADGYGLRAIACGVLISQIPSSIFYFQFLLKISDFKLLKNSRFWLYPTASSAFSTLIFCQLLPTQSIKDLVYLVFVIVLTNLIALELPKIFIKRPRDLFRPRAYLDAMRASLLES